MKKLIRILMIGLVLAVSLSNTVNQRALALTVDGTNLGDRKTGIINDSNFQMKIVDQNYHGPWGFDDDIPEATEIRNNSLLTLYGELNFKQSDNVKPGDYITITIPEEIKHRISDSIELKDPNGVVLAKLYNDSKDKVTMIFQPGIEKLDNIRLNFYFSASAEAKFDPDIKEEQKKDVETDFNLNIGPVKTTITHTNTTGELVRYDFSSKGGYSHPSDTNLLMWMVFANQNADVVTSDVVVTDRLGEGQILLPTTIQASIRGVENRDLTDAEFQPIIDNDGMGFRVSVAKDIVSQNKLYIKYETRLLVDGKITFTNEAKVTGSYIDPTDNTPQTHDKNNEAVGHRLSQGGGIIGDPTKVNYNVLKIWEGGPSTRPNIDIQLKQNGVNYGEAVQLKGTESMYTWYALPKFDANGQEFKYNAVEVNVPENYKSTVTDGAGVSVIKNTYEQPKTSVKVEKKWINGPTEKPDINLQLVQNGVDYGQPVTLKNGTTEHIFTDLPKEDAQGKAYVYTVKELSTPENYVSSVSEQADRIVITNTYQPGATSFTATKKWVGGPTNKPSITLELYRDDIATGDRKEIINQASTAVWENLAKEDQTGKAYKYSVKEVSIPTDYESVVVVNADNTATITNTYKSPKTEVTATKTWVGGPAPKPTIDIQLYANGVPMGDAKQLVDGMSQISWTNLDKTDANGNLIAYTVKEVNTPKDYQQKVMGLHIVNTYESPKGPITATKKWVGGPATKPDVTLQLFNGSDKVGEPVILKSGQESYTWNDLALTDKDGKTITYSVKEMDVPDNYVSTVDGLNLTNTYKPGVTSFTMKKVWVNGPQVHPDVLVQLYQDGVAYKEAVTLSNGTTEYVWENLPQEDALGKAYVYTVDEINVPDTYVKSVAGSTITNTYVSPKTDVSMNKVWIGGPADKPNIEVQLFQNGQIFGAPVVLDNGKTDHTWKDLDVNDKDGKPYDYTIKEVSVPKDYKSVVNGMTITNTFVSPKTEVSMKKVWIGGPAEKPSIEVQLFQNGQAFGAPVTLEKGQTDYTWKALDVSDKDGKAYAYTIKEVAVPKDYTSDVKDMTITNTYVSPKTEVSMNKVWIGGPAEKPSIEVQLYQNGQAFGAPVTLGKGQTDYTWKDLDVTDKDGKAYAYTVKEVAVPKDYTSDVKDMTITNTYVSPKTEVSMNKVWSGGPAEKPSIDVQLYQNGKELGAPVTLENGKTEYTWKDLDLTDAAGNVFTYSIKEVAVPDNYVSAVDGLTITNTFKPGVTSFTAKKQWVNGAQVRPDIMIQLYQDGVAYLSPVTLSNGITEYVWENLPQEDNTGKDYVYTVDEVSVPTDYVKSVDGATITNTYVSPKTEVSMNKVWNGGPVEKPSIDVQLFQNGQALGAPITLAKGQTDYTWKDLDVTDKDGKAYAYTVKEVAVPENYTSDVKGMTITNTYVSPKTEVSMNKVWIGGPVEKPSIDVQLFQNGQALGAPITLAKGQTDYTWKDLDVTDKDGKAYAYTVKEVAVPENYTSDVKGMTITNTYVSPKTEVSMNKVWIGGPAEKPSIEVQLFQNGQALGAPITLAKGQTDYTWKDLDVTDKDGKAYAYTVKEVAVPKNYTSDVKGMTITNTYVSPKTEVSMNKVWIGGPAEKPSIEVQLFQNGQALGAPITLAKGQTDYTWKDLDVTDKDGKAYAYTVKEVAVPENYTSDVKGMTITNTYVSPKTEVSMNKVWIGGPAEKPSIEVQLFQNGQALGAPITLAKGQTDYTWKDLDVTDKDGKAYAYTVKEVAVPKNYTSDVKGMTITNTYVSPNTSITMNKVWENAPRVKPTIDIQLYRNGEVYGNPVQLVDGVTTHTWKDLALTDNDGKPYVYTVKEITVLKDYEVTMSKDGLTITNRLIPEVEGVKKDPKDPKDILPATGMASHTIDGVFLALSGLFLIARKRRRA